MASQLTEEQKQIVLKADELVEAIRAREEQKDYWESIYQAKLEQITARRDEMQGKLDDEISTYKAELRTLVDLLPTKETKTQIKAELLGGDVVVKKAAKSIVKPNATELVTYLQEHKFTDYLKTKEVVEADWTAFKKDLTLAGDTVIYEPTGEIVELAAVKETQEEIIIK